MLNLESKIPEGPIAEKWTSYKFDRKLVNPANRRRYEVIVVGTGLAGGAAAATTSPPTTPAARCGSAASSSASSSSGTCST